MTAPPAGLAPLLRRGAAISTAVLVVVQLLSLAQTLVLARLLGPVQIGVFAAGTALTVLVFGVAEGGMRGAVIQREEADLEVAANTAVWATLAAGLGCGLLVLALAPAVGAFVRDPTAGVICAATAGVPVVQAAATVPDALLQRRFAFRRRLIADPAVALGFVVPSVVLAALGAGPWSMVAGLYVSNLVLVVATWALAGWRPGRARPSWYAWREMARYSFPLAVAAVADRARTFAEAALVGRWLGTGALGFYRYGRRVSEIPMRLIVEVGDYVLFPAFARIAVDPARFRTAVLRALRVMWLITMPVAGLLTALGTPIVVVLLGEQWRDAGVVLETMAGWGPGLALTSVVGGALKGVGRTRPLNLLTASAVVLGTGLLVGLVPWLGLAGVGLSVSAERVATGVLALALVRRTIGASARETGRGLVAPVVATALAFGAVGAMEHLVLHSERLAVPLALAVLVVEVLVATALYLGVLRLVAPALLDELREVVGVLQRRRVAPRSGGAGRIVWVSTHRATHGGVATYVSTMAGTSLWADGRVRHLASHVDGGPGVKAVRFLRTLACVVGLLAARRVDLVHLHTASRGSFVRKAVLLWTAWAGGASTVLHVHGGGFGEWYDACPAPLQALIRGTLRRADAVVALSRPGADRLELIAPGLAVRVVPNPVAVAPGPRAPRDRGEVRVVCVGRLGATKGSFDLLTAWAARAADAGAARLVLVGDGADADVARVRVLATASAVAGSVDVLGWVPPREVAAVLADADLFVLPSRVEAQPMAVLEAMAAGLPVVACAVGGVPELVEDEVTGVLVTAGDVVALRGAVDRLVADPGSRVRMGAAGRVRVRARHDPEAGAARLEEVYASVLSARGR